MDVSRYQGCFLGLAVGDALGYTIDDKSWAKIQETYGPNGLLGYDLANGCAEVSSYTQLAAYAANGLLMAVTRGNSQYYMRYLTQSLREWLRSQQFYRDPEPSGCWVAKLPILRRRHCRDSRMMDTLRGKTLGSPDAPLNLNTAPGAITEAVAVALSFNPKRMEPGYLGTMSVQAIALTHGAPEVFLSGAVLAYAIAGILQEPQTALADHYRFSISAMQAQFQERFPQAEALAALLNSAIDQGLEPSMDPQAAMEALCCDSCDSCLAGAMYASLQCSGDFDTGMILSVNHSGRSAAVGALTGALLGAHMGLEALPEFYLESLELRPVLMELARDLSQGSPTMGLFDDDWDLKYTQGTPLTHH